MTGFAHNNLGAAAFDGDRMLGFLCVWDPWDNAWDMQGLRHLFSPMHGNGTVPENRAKIYARLYQAAGEKWARAGAASHGICLYAHDTVGQEQFFRYGFGARTVDAIRGMDEIKAPPCEGYTFCEPAPEEVIEILPLENLHMAGYIDSPFFMVRQQDSETGFWEEYQKVRPVYFLARYNGTAIAYIKAELDGETFIQNTSGYLHVKGLYCLPEHRGKGVPQTLLNCLTQKLKSQGYVRLGVDFESFNPSGSGFWHKYFTAYTYGVVRRIDESAILKIREGC
jgi:GNAT superfamily N-acetyltransferase